MLPVVSMLSLRAFGRAEADLQEQQGAADRPTVNIAALFLACIIKGVRKGWWREEPAA